MRIGIARNGENIIVAREYDDIKDKGEICHILAELELIKLDLLEMFEDYNK